MCMAGDGRVCGRRIGLLDVQETARDAVVDIVSRENKQSNNRDDYFGRFLAAPLSCDVEASSVDRQHHT